MMCLKSEGIVIIIIISTVPTKFYRLARSPIERYLIMEPIQYSADQDPRGPQYLLKHIQFLQKPLIQIVGPKTFNTIFNICQINHSLVVPFQTYVDSKVPNLASSYCQTWRPIMEIKFPKLFNTCQLLVPFQPYGDIKVLGRAIERLGAHSTKFPHFNLI